jgi:hypothetical protein
MHFDAVKGARAAAQVLAGATSGMRTHA